MIATEGTLENPESYTILADTGRFKYGIKGSETNVHISTEMRCVVKFEHLSGHVDPKVLYSEEYVVDGSYFGVIKCNIKEHESYRLKFVGGIGAIQGTLTSADY